MSSFNVGTLIRGSYPTLSFTVHIEDPVPPIVGLAEPEGGEGVYVTGTPGT